MRIAMVGLGAIGGLLATRLAVSGADVSALARGSTLEAARRDGVTLVQREGADGCGERRKIVARIDVADDAAALGPQDVVVIAVKAPALASLAPSLAPLIGARTIVVPAMNGVPWWFFHGLDAALASRNWESIDPGGLIARMLPPDRVVGCVVHLACSTPSPARVEHSSGNRLIFGEPAGGASSRVESIARCFADAHFDVDVSSRIQQDVWYKLWGNMTFNPISAFTAATTDQILDDPLVRGFVTATMREAAEIGARIGLPIETSPEQRHEVTRRLGAFRTSMLQDVAAGRPVELDALVGSVVEIARAVGVATPNVDALFGLARLHARVHGLYPS